MKLRTFLFSLIALSFIVSLFAESRPNASVHQYEAVTLDSLDETGLLKLKGTTVAALHLIGSLISQDAKIGSLDVHGEATLKDTTVTGNGSVMGSLQAVRSTFQGPVILLSQKAVFTASHLEGITVQKDSGYKGKQVIELRQGTIVNGPIHFESGKGEVAVFSGSQALGTVTGGKIIKKS